MTDKLTTDERVKLAKFCGVDCRKEGDHLVRYGPQGECLCVAWHPDVDANQRDEVVEALMQHIDDSVVLLHWRNGFFGCHLGDPNVPNIRSRESTPGLAVCRAALKVIAES